MEERSDTVSRRQLLAGGIGALGAAAIGSMGIPSLAGAAPLLSGYTENLIFAQGQDPSVAMIGGKICYVAAARHSTPLYVRQADNIHELARRAYEPFGNEEMVWAGAAGGQGAASLGTLTEVWAQKIFATDEGVTIYAATYSGNAGAEQSLFALQASSLDEQFEVTGILDTTSLPGGPSVWAIDGSTFNFNGTDYFIWSGKEQTVGLTNQNIYIAAMENAYTLASEPVMISSPQYGWEFHSPQQGINEAPHAQVNDNGKTLVIEYSANASWEAGYCIGRLVLAGGDPLNPSDYFKWPLPVFKRHRQIFGPGSQGTVQDADGVHWLLYDNKTSPRPGWNNRQVRAQRFYLDEAGLPDYGPPRYTFI